MNLYFKIAGIISLLALFAWGAIADYDAGNKAGRDAIQTQWDKNKSDIAALATQQAADNARKLADAMTNNEGIQHDLQNQVDTLRTLNSDLAQRLRSIRTDSPTGRGVVPKVTNNPGPVSAAADDKLGQIDDAIAATLTECATTRANYKALIAEIKPQLIGVDMKAHVLLNVLNHVPSNAEWDGGDILTLPDGSVVSIAESAKTMTPGNSQLKAPVTDHDGLDLTHS